MKKLPDTNKVISVAKKNNLYLIIAEKDLKGRYPEIEKLCKNNIFVIEGQAVTGQGFWETLYKRYKLKNLIIKEISKISIPALTSDPIFISNSEGYIAKNIIENIIEKNPAANIVCLQHGMFVIERRKWIKIARLLISFVTKNIIKFDCIGSGIINKNINYYIVYNNLYKKQIIEQGIDPDKVIVSTETLKGKEFWNRKLKKKVCNDSIVLLLQPLSALGLITQENEIELLDQLISALSKSYQKVYIKQHPYKDISNLKLETNCIYINQSISDMATSVDTAISFFSEALHELEYLGVNTIALYDERIKVKKSIYQQFRNTGVLKNGKIKIIGKRIVDFDYYQNDVQIEDVIEYIKKHSNNE